MPRSAHLRLVNPNVASEVKAILLTKDKESFYDTIVDEKGVERKLGIYVKDVLPLREGLLVTAILDYRRSFIIKERKGKEIISKKIQTPYSEEIMYCYYSEISGSSRLNNAIAILSRETLAKVFENAVSKIVGLRAFLRVRFNFSPATEPKIRNMFDDIVKLKSDEISDDRIDSMVIKGVQLYQTNEYGKAFTGYVETLGVRIGNQWFSVSADGKITVWKYLSDMDFMRYVKEIIIRMLKAGAVIL